MTGEPDIDVRLTASGHRLIVLSGEPRVGDCRDCAHLVGYVTWWCDVPARGTPHNRGECSDWTPPPRARSASPWWRRLCAFFGGGT